MTHIVIKLDHPPFEVMQDTGDPYGPRPRKPSQGLGLSGFGRYRGDVR